MKKIQMAATAFALLVAGSSMAIAQRGGGAGGRGGAGYANLFRTIQVTSDQQKQIDSIGKLYTDSSTKVRTDYSTASGTAARGGGGRGGRGAGAVPLPDSIQGRIDTLTIRRNLALRGLLKPDQQKLFDKAVADQAAASGRPTSGGGFKHEQF